MYIKSCINFINEERKAHKKEFFRLLNLSPAKSLEAGETIVNAQVIKIEKNYTTVLSFPPQFTKLRDEKRIELYRDDMKIGEEEVVSVDLMSHSVTITGQYTIGDTFLIIQTSDIVPFAILNSLKKMNDEGASQVVQNLIDRKTDIEVYDVASPENIVKTVLDMNNDVMAIQGPPGTGKSFVGRAIVKALLQNGKKLRISSNSHSAINNLCDGIELGEFKGAKICSRSNQDSKNKSIKNISVSGKVIDDQVSGYDLIAGTCFSLCKIDNLEYDYLIIDEASQIKCSYVIAAARRAKNIIVLGDQLQLSSISILPDTAGGESVLNYILEDNKIIPKTHGYFLNKTYRMSADIASVVSDVFYESKLTWHKKEKGSVNLVTVKNTNADKVSKVEGLEVVRLYKELRRKHKVSPEEIMIIAPYNSQVAYLRSLIKNKNVRVLTVDKAQGLECDAVIFSCTSSGKKQQSSEFSTVANRMNVSISRAKKMAFVIASKGLQESKFTSPEFKKLIRILK